MYVFEVKSDFFCGSIPWRSFDMVKHLTFSMVAKCKGNRTFYASPYGELKFRQKIASQQSEK